MATKKERIADTAWMKDAFVDVQAELALKLKRAAQSISHAGTHGTVVEDHWIEVFRAYLPSRYQVATGLVIDSLGNRSDQIDIVIFDRHFTPTLLDQQNHRYIPVEAVYAIFESKPHFDKSYMEYAGNKAASVRKLHRTSVPIAHAGGTYAAKPLFPILAGIVAPKSSWADGLGEHFLKHLPTDQLERLDCGCALDDGAFDSFDEKLKVVGSEGSLIYFLFRLLSRLQSLGTVPAIDWAAYAAVINR
ncbi:TPA: hypothetical protein L3767_005948 [Pseudomonas aeruginosa]|uniref:DUF6602 domain-containing protein n=1 Tax=Pseudomonas fluorescens TaxID=294 RepID=A0A3S4MYN8_PSEFL|nr:DUF6602 domain-containing protein [Pseudomonas aeruginosa]VEE47685.1 Uncharacterised protein [Pseudomonas fluorescens]KSF60604.1 hypothetical protein AO931_12275 [Pseudomonas aeruginosa]MCV6435894.1 hypothetical protein [Pseudomonas aeruginosa]MCV6443099.1 hypothetical protein [Pseudomonas aeruginosa]HBN8837439.1 hypothetical protein [Pseudomonas aeruginosa]